MLTNQELVKRINRWAKKPKSRVPFCVHNESHGHLKAMIFKSPLRAKNRPDVVLMTCTKCDYKEFPPKRAYKKIS